MFTYFPYFLCANSNPLRSPGMATANPPYSKKNVIEIFVSLESMQRIARKLLQQSGNVTVGVAKE